MKTAARNCRRYLLILAAAALMALAFSKTAGAATANEKAAFEFFTDTMELSPAAACGIMSNIQYESGFQPGITGMGGAYGICQWTGVRQTRLRNWCSSHGLSYSSMQGQLRFLQYELKTYYPSVYRYMYSVTNDASGAYNAGYYWCYYLSARPIHTARPYSGDRKPDPSTGRLTQMPASMLLPRRRTRESRFPGTLSANTATRYTGRENPAAAIRRWLR